MLSETAIIICILAVLAFVIVDYIFIALAYMAIARKLKSKKGFLAWIPYARYFLFPILAGWEWPWGFMQFAPIANAVFACIWNWKIFEKRKYPGWLLLLPFGVMFILLPIAFSTFEEPSNITLIAFALTFLIPMVVRDVILGLVAWKDRKRR